MIAAWRIFITEWKREGALFIINKTKSPASWECSAGSWYCLEQLLSSFIHWFILLLSFDTHLRRGALTDFPKNLSDLHQLPRQDSRCTRRATSHREVSWSPACGVGGRSASNKFDLMISFELVNKILNPSPNPLLRWADYRKQFKGVINQVLLIFS